MSDTSSGIGAETTLADIVLRHPGSERVLEGFGLDYCCNGSRPLARAAAEAGLDADDVLTAILGREATQAPEWDRMSPGDLVDHIELTHHAFLHEELPRLGLLANKVATVHSVVHPELLDVARLHDELRKDLEPHLRKEEQILFPLIRRIADADGPVEVPMGSVRNPISVMMGEHDDTGDILRRLREVTRDYALPDDACGSYAALYRGLEHVEADTFQHIHKENNILFPAIVEIEERLGTR